MTANGERLSAVARRRHLRDVQLAAPSSPAGSPAPATAPTAVKDDKSSRPKSGRSSPRVGVDDSTTDAPSIGTANQFAALVDASAVHFSSTKEVDQVNETSVKVRLSQGQRCVLLGTCSLWVKQGSVSIYGATIHASKVAYQIYSPSTHALPAIEALSPKAEFQLDSLENGLIDLPSIGARNLWVPTHAAQSASSFYLLGHSFDHDPQALRRLKELNLGPWKPIISSVLPADDGATSRASATRILLCGKRSSGVSTLARCLINRLLTRRKIKEDKAQHTGVLVLDLDTNVPEYAPPGMISLVHVAKPLVGPSFTHVLSSRSHPNRILRMHFFGDLRFTDVSDWHIDRVLDLLHLAKNHCSQHPDTPIIVLAPKWWNSVEQRVASRLWANLAPTHIVCLDTSTTSHHLQPWKSLAEASQCQVHQVPGPVFDKIHSAREHDLQMQSYFHLADSSIELPFWNDMPILAGTYQEVKLGYGTDGADVCAVILQGGHVALDDTYDALEGNLVAIVAVKRQRDKEPASQHMVTEDNSSASSYPDQESAPPTISRTEEGLPRLSGGMASFFRTLGEHSFCMGLAMVVNMDIPTRQIALVSGHGLHEIEALIQGYQVALVLQKATSDGRYKADWARKEMRAGSG